MKQKPIFWILPVVATLLTSCFVIPSTYRVQIDDPTGKELESYYLLWWTHVGGVTAYWPSEVLFTQPDAEGKATVRLRIPTPKTYVLVLDRDVDYYATAPLSPGKSGIWGSKLICCPTNRLTSASPSVLSQFDERFFTCFSNQAPDYVFIREKWKSKYGKIIEEQGNSNRVFGFMKQ